MEWLPPGNHESHNQEDSSAGARNSFRIQFSCFTGRNEFRAPFRRSASLILTVTSDMVSNRHSDDVLQILRGPAGCVSAAAFVDGAGQFAFPRLKPDDLLHATTYAMLAGEFYLQGNYQGHLGSMATSGTPQASGIDQIDPDPWAMLPGEVGGDSLGLGRMARIDDNVRPYAGQRLGHLPSEALGAARDPGDLAGEEVGAQRLVHGLGVSRKNGDAHAARSAYAAAITPRTSPPVR